MQVGDFVSSVAIKVNVLVDGCRPKQFDNGDWVDLYTSEDIVLKPGDFKYIPLGVAMELPKGYEALMAPRSSTFKNWGLLQSNSIGVFDESFCGDDDQWMFPVYATREVKIPKGTRLCQFRVIEHQPAIEFDEVETLGNPNRGGWGSSGTK